MIKKKFIKTRNVSKITFTMPEAELPEGIEPERVFLAGEFNDWDPTVTPMVPNSKGVFQANLELEPGREYQFRYVVNEEHWCNDWHADAYIPNHLGADNCVVVTPTAGG